MSTHTRHLGNLDREELPLYQRAIHGLGVDLSIRKGAYNACGELYDESRYSLWGPLRLPNLQAFWDLVEGR